MKTRIEMAILSWALTAALLAGGSSLLASAWNEARGYNLATSLDVAPGRGERRTPPLRSGERIDHRIVVRGVFRGRFNGVTYDGRYASGPGGQRSPHNLLQLGPVTLAPRSWTPRGEYVFVSRGTRGLDGAPVTARLDLEPAADDMLLPPEERRQAFEGALRVEVWERDAARQSAIAGFLGLSAVFLLSGGLLRLSRQWPQVRRRVHLTRGSEHALLMRRLSHRRREALTALAESPDAAPVLRPRIDSLHSAGRELAAIAEVYWRAAKRSEPESQAQAETLSAYREHLARIDEIEAAFAALPGRLVTLSQPITDAEALRREIDEELLALANALGRAGELCRAPTPAPLPALAAQQRQ